MTHTQKKGPQWWKVDLGGAYNVNLVVIYNRWDGGREEINGASVYAGNRKCGKISYVRGRNVYTIPCQGVSASYVKITTVNHYLQLAEVQVFGEQDFLDFSTASLELSIII